MNRRQQRELVFFLLFEHNFTGYSLDEIKENKLLLEEINEKDFTDFVLNCFDGVLKNLTDIDELIEKNSLKWGKERLSKVALTLLRLATYEIMYRPDIPASVTINEAVELSKKYGAEKESSFINGILGGVNKYVEKHNL